jgi:hypothetical protein
MKSYRFATLQDAANRSDIFMAELDPAIDVFVLRQGFELGFADHTLKASARNEVDT